jgi:hypothetical protein
MNAILFPASAAGFEVLNICLWGIVLGSEFESKILNDKATDRLMTELLILHGNDSRFGCGPVPPCMHC